MTGAKPQLAAVISPRFSSTPSLGKRGEGADLAQLHGVISSIISCSISVLAVQLERMSLNLGTGQIKRRSVLPIVAFPFQDGAGIPVVHMEICGNSWMGASSLMPGTELQPRMKHWWHMPSMKTDAHKVP